MLLAPTASSAETPEVVQRSLCVPAFPPRSPVNPKSSSKKYLAPLTGLRFGLALWVIVHHLVGPGMMLDGLGRSFPAAAQELMRGGWVAVQVFFILSGLVLARTYEATEWNGRTVLRFAIARVARVYPAYLLSLVVVSPFIYYTLVLGTGKNFAPVHKAMLLTNYALVLQGWTGALGVGWNTPAWSLSCEFAFYFCFPFIMAALGRNRMRRTLGSLGLALLLPPLLSMLGTPGIWKPVHHLADFLMGIAAAGILESLRLRSGKWIYLPAGVTFAGMVAFPQFVELYVVLNTALRPVGAALLIGFGIGGGFVASLLSTRLAGFLGKASYSMYILHVPLLWWVSRYALADYFHLSAKAAASIYIVAVVAFAACAFHFVEEPMNRMIRTQTQSYLNRR